MTREEQEDALEAAKLAAFVGSQLNAVDQLYTDNRNMPSNRIDINNFVQKVRNPNANFNSVSNIPKGFAAPPSEEEIRRMIPDHVNSFVPTQEVPVVLPSIGAPITPVVNTQPTVTPKVKPTPKVIDQSLITRSDIDSIRNSLKGIDKSLSNMLDLLKNSKLTTND
jgi:hypothetical protein